MARETEFHDVELFVVIDTEGQLEACEDRDLAIERYQEEFGIGQQTRIIKLKLAIELPTDDDTVLSGEVPRPEPLMASLTEAS